MKKLILAALLCIFLYACPAAKKASIPQETEETPPVDSLLPGLPDVHDEWIEAGIDAAQGAAHPAPREVPFNQADKEISAVSGYTVPLSLGAFSGRLPAFGVSIAELDPVNYQKIGREAMEGMGMAPYYVAYLSGEKLYAEGNYDKAIAEFGRAISQKDDYADAYVFRGNAHRRKGDFSGAIDDYDRALSLKSNYAEVYNYRGFVYDQKGDLSRAVSDYTQAIRLKADYADAYFNRAYAFGRQDEWDRAIADYTQVIKLEPFNASAYNLRANAFYSKGDKERALADYETAGKLGL